MRDFTIARRYAKALLYLGQEDGKYLQYGQELTAFQNFLNRETQVKTILESPIYDAASRKGLLHTILEKIDFSPTSKSFLQLLQSKGRIGYLEGITRYYQKLTDELSNLTRAVVTAATPLSEDVVSRIQEALKQVVKKDVQVTVKQDPAIIGGIVAQVGDLLFDGSLQSQLKSLKESLRRGEGI